MSDNAGREWGDWLQLLFYFEHELNEGEITIATHETMTRCLDTFKPCIEIEYEKESYKENITET